jgi:hypothetical protein
VKGKEGKYNDGRKGRKPNSAKYRDNTVESMKCHIPNGWTRHGEKNGNREFGADEDYSIYQTIHGIYHKFRGKRGQIHGHDSFGTLKRQT